MPAGALFPLRVFCRLRVALPQLYRFVILEGRRRDDVLGGMAGGAEHRVGVAAETLHDLLALQIPNVHHVILAARHDPLGTPQK